MEHNLKKITGIIVLILTAIYLITGIILGLIFHLTFWNLLLVIFIIFGACMIGGLLGWLFLKIIIPKLTNFNKNHT
jgi:hypothetical protein